MSELNAYTADDIQKLDDERLEASESGKIDCTRVYLKSEADKVIADLEESHKKEVGQLLILNREQANAANRLRDSIEQALRRQKYKRCLAMAELCQYRSEMFFTWSKKMGFLLKWQNRWHELAKKFKEEAK